jgi:ubiquinone/menaquinone biosynthesis C-methylase UbiE
LSGNYKCNNMPLPRVLEPEVMSTAEEAGEYDEMDFSATDLLFAERAAQLARGANAPVNLIADLGSGNAKIPLAMCPLLPGAARVCAVEMSAEMLAVAARNRTRDGVVLQLVVADAKRVPFADRSVGMVTSNSLVHHIPDPRAVFQEIARIARPGAPILIRDLVRPETQGALESLVEAHAAGWSPLQRTLFSDSLHAALTLEEVRELLDECGLSDVTVAQITDRHWSAERA